MGFLTIHIYLRIYICRHTYFKIRQFTRLVANTYYKSKSDLKTPGQMKSLRENPGYVGTLDACSWSFFSPIFSNFNPISL